MNGPWCCIGDFNAILFAAEKQSFYPSQYKQIEEFGQVLDSCGLADLGFCGYPFTWNKKRPGTANTRHQLERAVANVDWKGKFQDCTITYQVSHASDHLPLLMQTTSGRGSRGYGTCGFKFEESWLLWDDCDRTIKEAWNSGGERDSAIANIQEKIRGYGTNLHA